MFNSAEQGPEKSFKFLVFLFLWLSEISCSVELSMKKVLLPRGQIWVYTIYSSFGWNMFFSRKQDLIFQANCLQYHEMSNPILWEKIQKKYSRLSLSRIPRDSLKHFEISTPRHIRVERVRKTINWTATFNKWICNLTPEVRNIYIK